MTETNAYDTTYNAGPTEQAPSGNSNGNVDPTPLRALCTDLHSQIEAFLQEDVETEVLRNVQKQCRHSLRIIQEALDRYP